MNEYEEYDYEQYGGLVNKGEYVRAARSDERENRDDLNPFMKAAIVCKQSLFEDVIRSAHSQSPDVIHIYEKLLGQIYTCIRSKSCESVSEYISPVCMKYLKTLIEIYDDSSVEHTHWLRRLFKETPYAFNMRATDVRK